MQYRDVGSGSAAAFQVVPEAASVEKFAAQASDLAEILLFETPRARLSMTAFQAGTAACLMSYHIGHSLCRTAGFEDLQLRDAERHYETLACLSELAGALDERRRPFLTERQLEYLLFAANDIRSFVQEFDPARLTRLEPDQLRPLAMHIESGRRENRSELSFRPYDCILAASCLLYYSGFYLMSSVSASEVKSSDLVLSDVAPILATAVKLLDARDNWNAEDSDRVSCDLNRQQVVSAHKAVMQMYQALAGEKGLRRYLREPVPQLDFSELRTVSDIVDSAIIGLRAVNPTRTRINPDKNE